MTVKKTISLLLVIIILLGLLATASAYDEEITFQGIPWGSSFDDSLKIMKEKGFVADESVIQDLYRQERGSYLSLDEGKSWGVRTYWYKSANEQQIPVVSQFRYNKMILPSEKKIAGYNVSSLWFSFVSQGENTKLICVSIGLDYKNEKKAYDDLRTKLTSIYGTPEHTRNSNGSVENYVWKGSNNSMVLLDFGQQSLHLYYGTLDAEKWLDKAIKEYVPTNTVDSNDSSGL